MYDINSLLHAGQLTPLRVLQSAAGWYIGRLYWDADMGGWFPYSRDSDYYPTQAAAQADLDYWGPWD